MIVTLVLATILIRVLTYAPSAQLVWRGVAHEINRRQTTIASGTLVIPLHEIQQSLHSKSVFCRNISNGRSNQKISKNKVVLFSNFASGRTLPTQSTGPQPIQLVFLMKSHCITLCKWSWLTLVTSLLFAFYGF